MKIEVPNSLDQIPVKAYQELVKIEDPTEQDTVAVLLGIDREVLRNLKSSSVDKLSEHLKSLFKRQHNLKRHFELDGRPFGFIPSLDDATYGEIDDIEDNINDYETWHKAMAVMYRPVIKGPNKKKEYLIEEYIPGRYDELMKDAPLSAALGCHVFFWTLINELSNCILNYMEEEALSATSKGILPENGEDIQGYLLSLKEAFISLKMPANLTTISQ